jgi:uncharacterized damage-inducible protein DinB
MAASQIRRLLDEIASIALSLDEATYRERLVPDASGSIGEHVRHCLDHIAALVAWSPSATLSYDHRERGTAVERDPAEALRQVLRLKAAIDRWGDRSLDEPLLVRSLLTRSGESVTGWSTLGREIAFVTSHTIHHQAVIGVLLSLRGVGVPEAFGYAPSTPRRAV